MPDASPSRDLLLAVAQGNASDVRHALHADVTLRVRAAHGFTALCIACEHGHLSCIDELLRDGQVDASQQSSGGWTPLMWAARNGHVECVTALCRRIVPPHASAGGAGALLDAVNEHGSTALMVAATCGHAGIIAALADSGACPTIFFFRAPEHSAPTSSTQLTCPGCAPPVASTCRCQPLRVHSAQRLNGPPSSELVRQRPGGRSARRPRPVAASPRRHDCPRRHPSPPRCPRCRRGCGACATRCSGRCPRKGPPPVRT